MGFLARVVRDGRRAPKALAAGLSVGPHAPVFAPALGAAPMDAPGLTPRPATTLADGPSAAPVRTEAGAPDTASAGAAAPPPRRIALGSVNVASPALQSEPADKGERPDPVAESFETTPAAGWQESTPQADGTPLSPAHHAPAETPVAAGRAAAGAMPRPATAPGAQEAPATTAQDDVRRSADSRDAAPAPGMPAPEASAERRAAQSPADHLVRAPAEAAPRAAPAPLAIPALTHNPLAVELRGAVAPYGPPAGPKEEVRPEVRIGHVDVIVQGGAPARSARRAAPAANRASRLYLRGL